jgi:hypothetical protein
MGRVKIDPVWITALDEIDFPARFHSLIYCSRRIAFLPSDELRTKRSRQRGVNHAVDLLLSS